MKRRGTNWTQENADFMDRMRALDSEAVERKQFEEKHGGTFEHQQIRLKDSRLSVQQEIIDGLVEENEKYKARIAELEAATQEAADLIE